MITVRVESSADSGVHEAARARMAQISLKDGYRFAPPILRIPFIPRARCRAGD